MDLNIRNFPEELLKQAKLLAVERGVTLREIVIDGVQVYVGQVEQYRNRAMPPRIVGRVLVHEEERVEPKEPVGIYERNNRAQVAEEQMRYAAQGLCEHGREEVKCLSCDWARRNRK